MSDTATHTYVRKLTFLQREEAFKRAVGGEPAHAIARDMGVTEGALRFHFRKRTHPKEVRRIAFAMLRAEQAQAGLTAAQQRTADRMVAKTLAGQRAL